MDGADDDITSKSGPFQIPHVAPRITVKRLFFSNGATVLLEPSDVIVFVGPNNSGKSAALRGIFQFIQNGSTERIFQGMELQRVGSEYDLYKFLESSVRFDQQGENVRYQIRGSSYQRKQVKNFWAGYLSILTSLFCTHLRTQDRIIDSDPQEAIAILDQDPTHPIHTLYMDDDTELRISGYFRQAFGEDLILMRGVGKRWPLHVGSTPHREPNEDRGSSTFTRKLLQATVPLSEQGDGMRSFASVLLHLLAPTTQSILLLDEPEAFLHPPQAKLIGEIIAKHRPAGAQLFVSTHSVDVLTGLLNVAPDQLRVIRLERRGNVSNVKELDKRKAKEIASDPLLKYSGVLTGIFHKRVIVCESDADCMFYNAVLDTNAVKGSDITDVLFTQASGKHRMANIAEAMVALNVSVDVIADIDVLNDEVTLKRLVEALGGDWSGMRDDWTQIKLSLESKKPFMQAQEVAKEIAAIVDNFPESGLLPSGFKERVVEVFRRASPWTALKATGENYFPSGTVTAHWRRLREACSKIGLWIVSVGELEGFCKTVGGHGPAWVQAVLETKTLNNDPELQPARDFVKAVWKSRA